MWVGAVLWVSGWGRSVAGMVPTLTFDRIVLVETAAAVLDGRVSVAIAAQIDQNVVHRGGHRRRG